MVSCLAPPRGHTLVFRNRVIPINLFSAKSESSSLFRPTLSLARKNTGFKKDFETFSDKEVIMTCISVDQTLVPNTIKSDLRLAEIAAKSRSDNRLNLEIKLWLETLVRHLEMCEQNQAISLLQ